MFVSNFLLAIVGYTTARILFPILTFGKIRVQPASSDEQGFSWFGLKRVPGQGLMCHTNVAGCLGLIPWIAIIVAVLLNARAG